MTSVETLRMWWGRDRARDLAARQALGGPRVAWVARRGAGGAGMERGATRASGAGADTGLATTMGVADA